MNLRYPLEVGRSKIINYLKKEASNGHYPGRHEIQERLGIWFYSYFDDIKKPYVLANIDITKLKFNPFVGSEKEKRLTKIASALLSRMGFRIIEMYRRNGADILVMDNHSNLIPVELKAYHRNNNLPISTVFSKKYRNEIEQIESYINNCISLYGILITTTNRIRVKIPKNVKLIDGKEIIHLLKKYKLEEHIPSEEWIRNTYSSFDRKINEDIVRKDIIKYVRDNSSKGLYPSMRNIDKKFCINVATYFKNMLEIYKTAKLEPPLRLLPKNEAKNKLAEYILFKVKTGRYPSLEDVEKRFKIHFRSYFKNANELYSFSKVRVPCKHMNKKEAIEIILNYCKQQILEGKNPTIRLLGKRFHISVYSYFKNADELHRLLNA